jgi:hypothetical protein
MASGEGGHQAVSKRSANVFDAFLKLSKATKVHVMSSNSTYLASAVSLSRLCRHRPESVGLDVAMSGVPGTLLQSVDEKSFMFPLGSFPSEMRAMIRKSYRSGTSNMSPLGNIGVLSVL